MKTITLFFALALTTSAWGLEVPAPLKALLKNKKEQLYVGQGCEMKVFENAQGFFIDAYERDINGNINQNMDFGRFSLNDDFLVWDFWQDSFGFEVVSDYHSSFGSTYDRHDTLTVNRAENGKHDVQIIFKKNNGIFMATFYRFNCLLSL